MKSHLCTVLLFFLILMGRGGLLRAESAGPAGGLVVVGGAVTIANAILPLKSAFEEASGIKFTKIIETQPSEILLDLLNGKADFAVGLGTLDQAKLNVTKAHPEITDFSKIVSYPIGRDVLKFFTASVVKVPELTDQQAIKLLTGDYTNWKELGGADYPIKFLKFKNSFGTWIERELLKGKPARKADFPDASIEEAIEILKKNPGAFILFPKTVKVVEGIQLIQTPIYGRPIYSFTKGAPSKNVKIFYDFVKGKGKSFLE